MSSTVHEIEETHVVRADNTRLASAISGYHDLVQDAYKADAAQHKQTIKQSFRIYKKAVFWSMFLSAALIMEGYDV